jgi:hypothetical protein
LLQIVEILTTKRIKEDLLEELTHLIQGCFRTVQSLVTKLTNKITGETRLIVINHDDNPGIDFEQMSAQYSWKVT